VTAAVRKLGLELRPNVNVPRGLKELLALGRFAVVDVGTNSVKFVIGERREDGEWRTVVDRAEVTRLGEGLDRAASSTRSRSRARSTQLQTWSRRPRARRS
jgi:exopolyphosphatase/guanosine-5'-triphosphate,3'-diphosphate pyrophosphatase